MIYRLKGERATLPDFIGMTCNASYSRGMHLNHATMNGDVFTDFIHSAPAGIGLPPLGKGEWQLYGCTITLDSSLPSNLVLFSRRLKQAYSLYNHYDITEMYMLSTEKPYTILDWLEINKRKDTQVMA